MGGSPGRNGGLGQPAAHGRVRSRSPADHRDRLTPHPGTLLGALPGWSEAGPAAPGRGLRTGAFCAWWWMASRGLAPPRWSSRACPPLPPAATRASWPPRAWASSGPRRASGSPRAHGHLAVGGRCHGVRPAFDGSRARDWLPMAGPWSRAGPACSWAQPCWNHSACSIRSACQPSRPTWPSCRDGSSRPWEFPLAAEAGRLGALLREGRLGALPGLSSRWLWAGSNRCLKAGVAPGVFASVREGYLHVGLRSPEADADRVAQWLIEAIGTAS